MVHLNSLSPDKTKLTYKRNIKKLVRAKALSLECSQSIFHYSFLSCVSSVLPRCSCLLYHSVQLQVNLLQLCCYGNQGPFYCGHVQW